MTTDQFLDPFGLRSPADLPDYERIRDLGLPEADAVAGILVGDEGGT